MLYVGPLHNAGPLAPALTDNLCSRAFVRTRGSARFEFLAQDALHSCRVLGALLVQQSAVSCKETPTHNMTGSDAQNRPSACQKGREETEV